MWFTSFVRRHSRPPRPGKRGRLLGLKLLEDRCVPSAYNVVDLGSFRANAINKAGVLAGTISITDHAALWQNGTIQDLGTLGGATSFAYDLNNLGQAVGLAQTSSGSSAFFWNSTLGMQGLGAVGWGYGVNDAGQVVGAIANGSFPHCFIWDSTHGLTDLGTFGGTGSQARAINQTGQMVGWVEDLSVPSSCGYIRDSGTGHLTVLAPLPGKTASRALDINDAGQVIGTSGSYTSTMHGPAYGYLEACLWQNGVMSDLGMPSANGINNLGQVVGGKYLWANGVLTDLNTLVDPSSGWVITSAADINDAGQIVGQGTLNGQTHYFLMNPLARLSTVAVNNGQSQRSMVTNLELTFSGTVTLGPGALALTRISDGVSVNLQTAVSTVNNSTLVTVTFAGTGAAWGSLADGRYQLTVHGAAITDGHGVAVDAGGTGQAGSDYNSSPDSYLGSGLHLFRLFGDANGDGVVDATDVGQLKSSFNRNNNDPLYLWFLDANADGIIDATDVGQFKGRFNTNVFG
jgi:probable HAF family extracellular repeat protein